MLFEAGRANEKEYGRLWCEYKFAYTWKYEIHQKRTAVVLLGLSCSSKLRRRYFRCWILVKIHSLFFTCILG